MNLKKITELLEIAASDISSFVSAISPDEAILVISLLTAGYCSGSLLNRQIDRIRKKGWLARLVDFLAPLLHALITLLLMALALALLEKETFSPHLLPLALKCTVAWFVIRLVMLMSTRRTAGWFIALVILPITLLQLFGIWEPLTHTLAEWEFSVGTIKLNAYGILRSIIAVAVLFWLAAFASKTTEERLRRMRSLRPSSRALVMKIFQIALYFVVFLIGLQILGVSLGALSVFGGALGVGIGFGLQKIASNFISGIILLFERSVQVDDLVELQDGTSGFIRHTGARYTLLELPDGREMLIPNEDFITQRTINLTYSNRKARVEIRLGIGYDSDIALARQLMLDAANTHPRCIKDPGAACFIDGFGDSSINLVLYFWVGDVTDGRLEPKSDVLMAIWNAFKAHHISIPYPQREVRVYKADAKPEEAGKVEA